MDLAVAPPIAADPTAVHCLEDLAAQLDRLRRQQGRRHGYVRTSLDLLGRASGIPRSTLHTYLSGSVLPPATSLDRIVLALGCGTGELRHWAQAWERVADAERGSRARPQLPSSSRLLTFDALVQQQLDRPTDRPPEQLEMLVIVERTQLTPARTLAWVDFTATVMARENGVDRHAMYIAPNPSLEMEEIEVVNAVNCSPGEHRTLRDPHVRVLEVELDHALDAGETCLIEYRVDFERARIPGVPAKVTTEVMRGFRRTGPHYTLGVSFLPEDPPLHPRQIQLAHADADENTVRELHQNRWHGTHVVVQRPAAGLHGIRWEWPS
ncbi:MAG: transcriptional regulator, family [Marmoricola sp.]|nr:transcriptional regulator, family [Marmoricola sp.]